VDILDDVVGALRLGRVYTSVWVAEEDDRVVWPDTDHVTGFRLVAAGRAHVDVPGGPGLGLTAGDLAFFPRGSAHELSVPPGSGPTSLICGAYEVNDTWRHPLLTDLPDVYVVRGQATPLSPSRAVGEEYEHHGIPDEHGASARALTQIVVDEIARPRPGQDTVLASLLDLLMLSVLRAWVGSADATGWTSALSDPVLAPALKAMHEHPERDWSVAGLAARAAMSRSGFARRFTDVVGMPPLEYLTRWRMQLAAQHLRSDDASIRSIAARVGYRSEFAFSRAFTRNQGIPPATYRRNLLRGHAPSDAATVFGRRSRAV
jgi:AraC-like DNA-binding protein